MRELFEEEVATWVALEKHPNIVRCFYMEILDNQPFMFLEWIAGDESRGTDLRSWLRRGPLDLRLALDFTIDICRGLIHAGQKQPSIVHRDLKPENILVAQGRLAKITDWGLAKIAQEADLEIGNAQSDPNGRQSLVGASGIVGTPAYMAPEQWRGEELDARTDIYAVGCILYEMLTGRSPFEATTLNGLCRQHLRAATPTLGDGNSLPKTLDTLLARCLAKQGDERFATADNLLQELSLIYQHQFAEMPKAIELSKKFTAIDYSNRGATYSDLQHYDKALADHTCAIQLDPTLAQAYYNRGTTYAHLQRYREALADFTRAIQLDPTLAQAYSNRGNAYDMLHRYKEALADFTRAIQLGIADALLYTNRGNAYYSLQRYKEALVDYVQAIKLDPTYAPAYTNRGLIFERLQRYEEALADHMYAIKLDPTLAPAYFNIGVLLANLGAFRDALPYFERAAQFGEPEAAQYAIRVRQMLNKWSS